MHTNVCLKTNLQLPDEVEDTRKIRGKWWPLQDGGQAASYTPSLN
jgi:hypothetical protein